MGEALSTWHGAVVIVLFALTCILAVAEFLGGPELKNKINEKLYNWWDLTDDIPPPKVGQHEAEFALRTTRSVFGPGPFSGKRVLRCLMAVLAIMILGVCIGLVGMLYSCIADHCSPDHITANAIRFLTKTSLTWIVEGLILTVMVWASIGITELILRASLSRFRGVKHGGFYFIAVLIFSVVLTGYLTRALTIGLVDGVIFSALIVGFDFRNFLHFPNLPELKQYSGAVINRAAEMISLVPDNPLTMWSQLASAGQLPRYFDEFDLLPRTIMWFLFWFRALLAIAFFAWWFAGRGLEFIKLALRRLFEYKSGALTVFSAILTALAGFVALVFK